ncbi:hypothetical protein RE943_21270 [Prescottella equi]|nr:hypothetical protein RE943_21270 [Prescottella equi]
MSSLGGSSSDSKIRSNREMQVRTVVVVAVGPVALSSNTFRQESKRFVRHAAWRGFAELPDQRRVLGGNIAGVEGVGDLGLPAEHPAQCEDPCSGRYLQQ